MSAEQLLSQLSLLNRLKAEIRPFVRGLRMPVQFITFLEGEERLSALDFKWRMELAAAALADPTSSYNQMAEAAKAVTACVHGLYRKALEWDDADTECLARALEDISSEVGTRIFGSPLWRDLGRQGA